MKKQLIFFTIALLTTLGFSGTVTAFEGWQIHKTCDVLGPQIPASIVQQYHSPAYQVTSDRIGLTSLWHVTIWRRDNMVQKLNVGNKLVK